MSPIELAREQRGVAATLHLQQRWDWQRRWRQRYASSVKSRTGTWVYGGFDWHAFSWEFSPAKSGEKARTLYFAESSKLLVVVPESPKLEAFTLRASSPPDFGLCGTDLEVFPPDLSWTAAFTHEPDSGPYFSRAAWCSG